MNTDVYLKTVRTSKKKSVKFQDTKINIQKSVVFLCTSNKISEREIWKTVPFTISSKRKRYLGMSLTKEVLDLYTENCKTVMNETEENTQKNGDILCT